jgi:hypothetical protein
VSGATADLPATVAETRAALGALVARLAPDRPPEPAPLPERPVVAVVGAPGRGRHALVAALLGLGETPGRAPLHLSADPGPDGDGRRRVAVPLLEELDLWLPARPAGAAWAVEEATAVLVLAAAGAPLGGEELDAIAALAGRVDTVVLAMTGIEAHRGWRTVLEADRDLLAERVPRLAGARWFPVSPVLARTAEDVDAPEAARLLRERCGIAELQRELHRLVARRRRMLGEANALRVLGTTLAAIALRADDTLAALAAPDADGAVARRRDDLIAARESLRGDHRVRWRADLAAARVASADLLGGRLRELAARARARIEEADRAALGELPDAVAAEVAALAAEVVDDLGARLRSLVHDTLAGLLPPAEIATLRVPEPARPRAAPAPPGRRPEDRLLVVAGASGGLGLSRLALLPLLAVPVAPALSAALVPVSVGLGLGAAGWLARSRRLAADRAHLRQWLGEALAEVRGDLERVLADALIDAEREVTLALDAALASRARELDEAVAAVDRAVRTDGVRRAEAAREARRVAAEARAGRDRAEELLIRMAHLRDRG